MTCLCQGCRPSLPFPSYCNIQNIILWYSYLIKATRMHTLPIVNFTGLLFQRCKKNLNFWRSLYLRPLCCSKYIHINWMSIHSVSSQVLIHAPVKNGNYTTEFLNGLVIWSGKKVIHIWWCRIYRNTFSLCVNSLLSKDSFWDVQIPVHLDTLCVYR